MRRPRGRPHNNCSQRIVFNALVAMLSHREAKYAICHNVRQHFVRRQCQLTRLVTTHNILAERLVKSYTYPAHCLLMTSNAEYHTRVYTRTPEHALLLQLLILRIYIIKLYIKLYRVPKTDLLTQDRNFVPP